MPRNETMYQNLEDEAIHMGKVIVYYNLELSACAPCTGYNKLHDINTTGVQIGDTIMNVSEAECWTNCADYPDSGCSTAVFDGLNCALKTRRCRTPHARLVTQSVCMPTQRQDRRPCRAGSSRIHRGEL
jgi:hypothetical protein